MEVSSLKELYSKVNEHISTVFVVPLIRYQFPKTDYLYLLYKELILNHEEIEVKSVSVFNHFRFVLTALINRKTVILHYHWLEFQDVKSLLGMPYKLFCIALYHLLGGKTIWTVHNLKPHDKKYLSLHSSIHTWMAKKATLIHVHSAIASDVISKEYDVSKEKIVILKHPKFPAEILKRDDAIKNLLTNYGNSIANLNQPVFLIFGGLSEYKGIQEIVSILTSRKEDFFLIIAGYVKKGQEKLHRFIIKNTVQDQRVLYIPTFIPEEHYPYLLNTADVCVFNYDEILTSGGVEMANSYQKKIIAPNKGGLKELKDKERVFLFNSKSELENLLIESLKRVNV